MSWIDKILPSGVRSEGGEKRSSVPEGLWKKCVKCEAVLYRPDVERNDDVCPKCDHHMRIGARRRLDVFLDEDGRQEILTDIEPIDRLKFKDKKRYRDRLAAAQKATGEKDALIAMMGTLQSLPLVVVAFEFKFHLSLRKLYQQVIGGNRLRYRKTLSHLQALTRSEKLKHIKNLVYFGENDNGFVVKALIKF